VVAGTIDAEVGTPAEVVVPRTKELVDGTRN